MKRIRHLIAWILPFCVVLAACTTEVADSHPASSEDSAVPESTGVAEEALTYRYCSNGNDCAGGCVCQKHQCQPDGFGPPNPDCGIPPQRACTQGSDCQAGCMCAGGTCQQDGFGPPNPFCYLPPSVQSSYVGCYTDDPNRALPVLIGVGHTIESCVQAARQAGFSYAGVQWYGQCFGGNALGYTHVADSECNTPCTANPSEMCGGPWRNSIYRTH